MLSQTLKYKYGRRKYESNQEIYKKSTKGILYVRLNIVKKYIEPFTSNKRE